MPRAETIRAQPVAQELDRAEMERLAAAFELDAGDLNEFRADRRPARAAWRRAWVIAPVVLSLAVLGVFLAPAIRRAGAPERPSAQIATAASPAAQPATGRDEPARPAAVEVSQAPTLAEADRGLKHGLLLVAQPGDTLPSLYGRVYRGLTPPPYETVAAMNKTPLRPGSRVLFPAPVRGWAGP